MDADVTGSVKDAPRVRRLSTWATAAFLALVGGIALASGRPPRALPADAPADVFSARRAMRHVEAIAFQSHPLGSPSEKLQRSYIIDELKNLGP